MPKSFPRRGLPLLDEDGRTIRQSIQMTNSAVLNIIGGGDPSFFSMGFGTRNSSAASWCVDKRCIEELIAELLYIRDDMIQAE